MDKDERAQSLINARLACEWLDKYVDKWDKMRAPIDCLIAEFRRLDAGETKRNEAGATQRRLNAQYGHLGGRPRKTTKKRGKK